MRTPVISASLFLIILGLTWAQSPLKKHAVSPKASKTQCCDDVRALKVQVANLTSLLEELSKKQEADRITLVKQVMELEKLNQQQEARVTEAESKYSEINNRVDIMQFQAMQGAPQTTLDAIYDCASLYNRNYRISGLYKLPKDDFLGTPELEASY
ncbi:Angiopoietin-related protein 7 [Bagarius yarrelli]|uniref:Angiopoietin-related protein 7 n=1 Tax=Bagarius yarrelli TaxID=175774 RepID=A0A556U217_BAGYA|nr:Angiopoietin-related protein 7 [Bagarius yarrelli]